MGIAILVLLKPERAQYRQEHGAGGFMVAVFVLHLNNTQYIFGLSGHSCIGLTFQTQKLHPLVTPSLYAIVTIWIKMVKDCEPLTFYLLFHLLDLLHRAAPLVFVLHSDTEDWIAPANLLLLLLLSLLQFALCADAL